LTATRSDPLYFKKLRGKSLETYVTNFGGLINQKARKCPAAVGRRIRDSGTLAPKPPALLRGGGRTAEKLCSSRCATLCARYPRRSLCCGVNACTVFAVDSILQYDDASILFLTLMAGMLECGACGAKRRGLLSMKALGAAFSKGKITETAGDTAGDRGGERGGGRGLHSFTFRLNVSAFC
jgi:hypothetical protein